jgi:hypothetical protein
MNSDRWAAVGAIAGVVGVVVTLFIYLDQRNSPADGGINPTPSESPTAEYQEPTDPVNPIEETSNEDYSDTEITESEAGNEGWVQEWEEVWLYLVPTGTPDNCPSTAADFDEEVEDEYYVHTDADEWGYVPGADLAWNSCSGSDPAYLTIVDSSWDVSASGRSVGAEECWSRAVNGDQNGAVFEIDPGAPDLSGFGEGATICATTSAGDRVVRAIVEYAAAAEDGVYLHLSVSMWVR